MVAATRARFNGHIEGMWLQYNAITAQQFVLRGKFETIDSASETAEFDSQVYVARLDRPSTTEGSVTSDGDAPPERPVLAGIARHESRPSARARHGRSEDGERDGDLRLCRLDRDRERHAHREQNGELPTASGWCLRL